MVETGIDGAEIARRMILATEAAASAASQAVKALEDFEVFKMRKAIGRGTS